MTFWTTERSDELKALYSLDLSCAAIAATMGRGLTRNAIIGRVHRMNLEPRGARGNGRPVDPNRVKKKRIRNRQGDHHAVFKIVAANGWGDFKIMETRGFRDGQTLRCVEIAPLNKTLLDLETGDCRFPYGGDDGIPFTFCGHPKRDDSSYCVPHHALALRPFDRIPKRDVAA